VDGKPVEEVAWVVWDGAKAQAEGLEDPHHPVSPTIGLDELAVWLNQEGERAGREPEEVDVLVNRVHEARGVRDEAARPHHAKRLPDR
jgi:hypothetical protein